MLVNGLDREVWRVCVTFEDGDLYEFTFDRTGRRVDTEVIPEGTDLKRMLRAFNTLSALLANELLGGHGFKPEGERSPVFTCIMCGATSETAATWIKDDNGNDICPLCAKARGVRKETKG